MKQYISPVMAFLFCIGTIDQISNGLAHAELRSENYIYNVDFPIEMFPCEISEGDLFYITTIDGVTELRCGEPDPQ